MKLKNTKIPTNNSTILNFTGKIYKVKNHLNFNQKTDYEHETVGKSFRCRKLDISKNYTNFENNIALKDGTVVIEVWEDINADMYDKIVLSDETSGIINADIKVVDEMALSGKSTFKKYIITFG